MVGFLVGLSVGGLVLGVDTGGPEGDLVTGIVIGVNVGATGDMGD
jgi:small-conductance mechanosensitive channel